ncbi:MAG TPA: cytochrome c [Polyangiaceae bacterium]|nr:cytochrome c [Polyangiaceae bacterium]
MVASARGAGAPILTSFASGVGVCALALACASTPPGASDPDLAQAKSRASDGAALYGRTCAGCHGPRGEGLAGAPPIVGVTGMPRYPRDQSGVQLYQDPQQIQRQAQLRVPGVASRPEFVTAQDVFQYLQRHRTEVIKPDTGVDVGDPDLWAILTFVLIAHGSQVPEAGVSPENAGSVMIRSE